MCTDLNPTKSRDVYFIQCLDIIIVLLCRKYTCNSGLVRRRVHENRGYWFQTQYYVSSNNITCAIIRIK